jgi:hypothetical protein
VAALSNFQFVDILIPPVAPTPDLLLSDSYRHLSFLIIKFFMAY